jgi:hypothetical protein
MKNVKLGLSRKSVPEKIAQGNTIKTAMTGNANFNTPLPPLADLGTATNTLQAKLIARDIAIEAAKAATAALHAAALVYDNTITQLAAYAENVTAGDPVKLESGGFELRADAVRVTELGQVEDLKVITNGYPGRFKSDWKPLSGAKSYEVQLSVDPVTDSSWETVKVASASKTTIDDLPSGQRRWQRVRGVVKDITGQWSEPVSKIVP